MATREQEKKALDQIRKIVEGLGEDSYVGTAFDGCFEVAEQNLENDWFCSLKHRAESAEMQIESQAKEIERLSERLSQTEAVRDENFKEVIKFRELAKKAADALDAAEEEAAKMQKRNDFLEDQFKVLKEDCEDQIIRLKAKLYDLITK